MDDSFAEEITRRIIEARADGVRSGLMQGKILAKFWLERLVWDGRIQATVFDKVFAEMESHDWEILAGVKK